MEKALIVEPSANTNKEVMPHMAEKQRRYSEAQNKATQKYIKENLEEIKVRVKKGEKERYRSAAENSGMSMAKFFITAAEEKIERDGLAD